MTTRPSTIDFWESWGAARCFSTRQRAAPHDHQTQHNRLCWVWWSWGAARCRVEKQRAAPHDSQKSIVLGLVVMGCGALLFYPAAAAKSYALFLGALWVLASGMTLLQVAANPYVAQLGAPAKASSRLNLAQAFNSLGTAIGPYLGGMLILSETAARADVRTVQLPYIGIALTLFLLAFGVSRFHLPSLPDIEEGHGVMAGDSIWQHRHLVLGAIGIFVYVGAEVSI